MLRAARTGEPVRTIAEHVHLAPGTVRNYLSSAMTKLDVPSRHAAAYRAWERAGSGPPPPSWWLERSAGPSREPAGQDSAVPPSKNVPAGFEEVAVRRAWIRRGGVTSALVAAVALGVALPVIAPTASAAGPATSGGEDPGPDPWVQVPRDEVAERCGLDPDLMDAADLALVSTPYTVVRHGQLCWTGGYPTGASQPYSVWSITKTFGAVLVGAVAARSSLDDTDPVVRWLDESELGDVNPDATIAHVLAMTATEPDLAHGEKGPWSYDTFGDREINLLVEVVERVIASEPESFPDIANAVEFAQQEIFDRLGMASTTWAGESIAGGMISSPEDLARLGLLILRRGTWDGEQLLDERYVYRMTHPAFEDANTGYGYLTYVNAHSNWAYSTGTSDLRCAPFGTWPSYPHAPFFEAPDDNGGSPHDDPRHDVGVAYAFGAGGQRIAVHRGLDLVITVRDSVVSTDEDDPGTFEGHKSVWAEIRPALVELDPTFAGDEDAFCDAYQRSAHAPDLRDPWSRSASSATPGETPPPAGSGGDAVPDDASPPDRRDSDGVADGPGAGAPLPATGGPGASVVVTLTALVLVAQRRRRPTSSGVLRRGPDGLPDAGDGRVRGHPATARTGTGNRDPDTGDRDDRWRDPR